MKRRMKAALAVAGALGAIAFSNAAQASDLMGVACTSPPPARSALGHCFRGVDVREAIGGPVPGVGWGWSAARGAQGAMAMAGAGGLAPDRRRGVAPGGA